MSGDMFGGIRTFIGWLIGIMVSIIVGFGIYLSLTQHSGDEFKTKKKLEPTKTIVTFVNGISDTTYIYDLKK